jgi:hypothetical protein
VVAPARRLSAGENRAGYWQIELPLGGMCFTMIRMTAPLSGALILCDSCGVAASAEHIRARLERLELATRYRPVHVGLLLICTAPPAAIGDDLYAWEQQKAAPDAKKYLEGLLQSVGIGPEKTPVERLAEFQRRGIYLARLVECQIAPGKDLKANIATLAGVMVKRITQSYKPARIGLLAPVAPGLAEALKVAGLNEKLIAGGDGIEIPSPGDKAGIARTRKMLEAVPSTA